MSRKDGTGGGGCIWAWLCDLLIRTVWDLLVLNNLLTFHSRQIFNSWSGLALPNQLINKWIWLESRMYLGMTGCSPSCSFEDENLRELYLDTVQDRRPIFIVSETMLMVTVL